MSKRTVYTTVTPLPAGITRETVMETLHSHTDMIDLNPLVEERHPIKPPSNATPEEYHCTWYQITDRVEYLPGGIASGKVSYNACFHDLKWGIQTHCYAPMGLDIRGKWTLGGSLPGEPIAPVELGLNVPLMGLYLREDIDMRCNVLMTSFVKKTTKKAHQALIDRLVVKAQIVDAVLSNRRISNDFEYKPDVSQASILSTPRPSTEYKLDTSQARTLSISQPTTEYSPSEYEDTPTTPEAVQLPTFQDPGRDRGDYTNNSLYPAALRSGRNSNGSYHSGSIRSQGGNTHQSSLRHHPSQRVSYQDLQPRKDPPMQQQQISIQGRSHSRSSSLQQQQVNRSRHNSVQSEHIDLHFETPSSRNDKSIPQFENQFPYPNPALVYDLAPSKASRQYFHAELDGGYAIREERNDAPLPFQSPPAQYGHAELQA